MRYFDAERAGYAAAIGVFSFVMIMVISMIVNGYFRKKEVDLLMSMTKEEKKEYKKKLKQMKREEVEHYKFKRRTGGSI